MSEFVRFVALRYLLQSRKKGALSFISLISVLGIAIGVATLISVMSVMDGIIAKTEETVLKSSSHANVYKLVGSFDNPYEIIEKVKKIPGVTAASPVVYREALLMAGTKVSGAVVNGIDPKLHLGICNFSEMMKSGSYDCFENPGNCAEKPGQRGDQLEAVNDFLDENSELHPVLLGSDLAEKLNAKVGTALSVVVSKGRVSFDGDSAPASENFTVVGIFETGMYDNDSRSAYMRLQDVKELMKIDDNVSFVSTRVENPGDIGEMRLAMHDAAGGFPFSVQDWRDLYKTTFKFYAMQKTIMFIVLIFIVLVASFGIISTLIMLVIGKTREVSILRSLGAKKSVIVGIFMLDGTIIGAFGNILGALLSVLMCLVLQKIEFPLSKEIYSFSTMPVVMSFSSFAGVMLSTFLISVAVTLYPSLRAAGITPVEGLAHE
jgi:lipoprotein-releasing system permease protein